MPGSSEGGRRRLERALKALRDALDSSGAPWMVIGGLAVIARGVRRMTTDVDAVVQGDAIPIPELVPILGKHGLRPRMRLEIRRLAALADAPELADGFEAILARVGR